MTRVANAKQEEKRLLPRNLGVVLSMKLRAGELSEADLDRLQVLHGKRLPDLAEIPEPFASSYEHNARMRRAA